MERVIGVEPTTLCLASIRSSQLSYTRMFIFLPDGRRFVNFRDHGPTAFNFRARKNCR